MNRGPREQRGVARAVETTKATGEICPCGPAVCRESVAEAWRVML
jgi:hypothetical protein